MKQTVHLGFELGTGTAVDIPLKHLAICGQTQEAGKTTALEALITRAGLPAITFVTKRGEGSFQQARRIDPYFREQADWQFVASILEASRGEKLKFERAWIIRASKGAKTLADVHRNVKHAMEKAKGLSADVYLTLDAYLEAVVPQIARIRWAPGLSLSPGVNVMDLAGLSVEMQHLVIKSSLDWVLAKEEGTVVVIPEAWKFIPEGRGTPVKLAAEAFIRQAAGMRNYLWLDSQDLGGIAKVILRSVPLWILGVQREANEIKRTLSNIPASIAKPKAADVATLELGQFYACWGKHVRRVYAQPGWLDAPIAQNVAIGTIGMDVVDSIAKLRVVKRAEFRASDFTDQNNFYRPVKFSPPKSAKEDEVNAAEAQALQKENEELRLTVDGLRHENSTLQRRLDALERGHSAIASAEKTDQYVPPPARRSTASVPASSGPTAVQQIAGATPLDNDALYRQLLTRLVQDAAKDPTLLRVIAQRPELEVKVTRRVVEVDGDSLRGRCARLVAEGFFDSTNTGYAAFMELKRTWKDPGKANVYKHLDKLYEEGFLTKTDAGYQAVPGMKVNIVEAA